MYSMEKDAIKRWIEDVATDNVASQHTSAGHTTYCAHETSGRPRQRPSSPNRIKSNLALGTPKIKYLHESADPGSNSARQLLAFLSVDNNDGWEPETQEIDNISVASCKCATQLRSEGSWVIGVVRPLLQCAIGTLPLECWSVQTESVDSKYQPRYTVHDAYSRKVDLVIGFPTDQWSTEYERMTSRYPDRCFSHIAHPRTRARFLGSSFEVKASDGNLIEAQVQLGVWMAGLMTWAWDHGCGDALPPPAVGCISIGEHWEFYIIYSVKIAGSDRLEVHIWGPFGRAGSHKATTKLAKQLQRVMEYTRSQYLPQLLRAISS
ncbi:hypothetical protein BDV26DRAFT_283250 [Aspergillus bertholletiae]|uniref:PD-(D/E)XK nuclease-like domain-containing protein n=1 Tax=Aspergillus bertholletiae TaxID=1226010 RepID=A0A5N7B131_9EURO|nr:hypothetical protein BDV26DRAFT_283250 [Aspergillus bertholletiae]